MKTLLLLALCLTPFFTLSSSQASIPKERQINNALVSHLATTFNKPEALVRKIVRQAIIEGRNSKFPTAYDILAVAQIESGLNPYAISKTGALGLMQIQNRFWGIRNLTNPVVNIKTGAYILQEYHYKFKTTNGTLLAYNTGPSAALKKCTPGKRSSLCSSSYSTKFHLAKADVERFPLFERT